MSTYVGIDGGKSGLRVLVQSPDGRLYGEGPGFAYGRDDVASIVTAVGEAVRPLDLPTAIAGVCAGLTGVPGDARMRQRVRQGIEDVLGAPALLVEDVVIAHAGALGGAGAVACVGTGVTVLALSGSQRTGRIDGWGPIIGDRGSAYAIGQRGLQAAAAALDGAGPATRLSEAFVEELGGAGLHDVQDFYRDASPVARTAAFAAAVVADADRGDPVAREICLAAADDLARSVEAAGERAKLADHERIASYAGRLLDSGTILLQAFRARLTSSGWEVVRPRGGSLDGGVALAHSPHPTYHAILESWKDTEEC
ncbi:BadF/BadG/BcrA/BcrD ATPase family protein [Mumia sp. DW29H23]|uniref:BadF/BadG/BcrA/BcrD ATPase family protein n=1 Tax=Mumia sp. DW29H23 TaxID=3421241 RepID=UPI003D683710